MSTVEKVYKLIALAGSDNPNEANAAALKACALIRQHDLRIIVGAGGDAEMPADAPPSPTWASVMRTVGVGLRQAPEVMKQAVEIAEGLGKVRDILIGKPR